MASYGSWYFDELPIRADQASVDQFCTDKGYGSAISFTGDDSGTHFFSNDGGRIMNYYGAININPTGTTYAYYWMNIFGYDATVTSITT